jgi:hypothetical protein
MSLRVGAASVEITPQGPAALFGYPHVPRISRGVHDPLLAAALWLSDGECSIVLVSLDLLLLDPPTARSLRTAVAAATGTPEKGVFIGCTHTHSGPVTGTILAWSEDAAVPPADRAYLEWMAGRVVEASGRAAAGAGPARLAWTTADGRGVGGNRHAAGGPTDPEAGVLAVQSAADGRLLALAVIYGMHPTVLHQDSLWVSADFPHYVREELRGRFGHALTVLYLTGPSGNQSPRFFVAAQTFAEAQRLGRTLGRAVSGRVESLGTEDFAGSCRLHARRGTVALPRRALPSVAEAERVLAAGRDRLRRLESQGVPGPLVRTAQCAVFGAEGVLTLARLRERGELDRAIDALQPIEIHALTLGDAQLAGFPGELFAEYGLELKRRSRGRVFPVSLVGGHLQGYVVTAQAAGQYEGLSAVFDGPSSGRIMVEKALELLGQKE